MIRTASKSHIRLMTVQPSLPEHHGGIHLKDSPGPLRHSTSPVPTTPRRRDNPKGLQKPWYGNNRTAHCGQKPMRRPGMSQRNITEKVNTKNTYDEHGHIAHNDESEQPTEWDYVEDDDTAAALVSMAECDHDETPAEELDDLAEAAQQLYAGYMAAGTQKGKTKGFKCKDKGKSKGKHIFRTQLSVQDRAKRLAELKKFVPNASNVEAPAIGQVIPFANSPARGRSRLSSPRDPSLVSDIFCNQ